MKEVCPGGGANGLAIIDCENWSLFASCLKDVGEKGSIGVVYQSLNWLGAAGL